MTKKLINKKGQSKGQVLVLVALIFLVLVAFIGLAIDVGMVFVNYANLRRAVDSAALAAATKYRLNVTEADMEKIALEYLRLNGVDDPAATVTTCDSEVGLCPGGEERKLVHVVASTTVNTTFISVLGFDTIDVTAEAVSEAASLDVILVLDTSESMTFEEPKNNAAAHGGLDFRDPQICNADDAAGADGYPGECHPFEEVKAAAVEFVNQLYFPYDRVGVVTFDRWAYPMQYDAATNPNGYLALTNNKATIINYIKTRSVTPWLANCPLPGAALTDRALAGPCADYSKGYYELGCDLYKATSPYDPTTCGTTNIGAGMELANNLFGAGTVRENALWVVILLTDGAANASVSLLTGPTDPTAPEYFGYCPTTTWSQQPFCRDPWSDPEDPRPVKGSITYDAADFAYDMIDIVADRDPVQNISNKLIYAIGLGPLVTQNTACWDPVAGTGNGQCDPEAGLKLLEYAADQGDGNYYYTPNTSQLKRIFIAIAENIAFRLTR
jgi:Flp pilus assembly protein TadG